MAVQINTLTRQLKQQNFAGVLQATLAVPEQDKTDDLKLLELIARIKSDQSSPMVQHYLSESAGWTYEHPNQLLAERAFLHLLQYLNLKYWLKMYCLDLHRKALIYP